MDLQRAKETMIIQADMFRIIGIAEVLKRRLLHGIKRIV